MIIQPTTVYYLNCKGKSGVIRIFNLIYNSENSEKYDQAWICFFLDRDFDAIAEHPNSDRVYITPCYSIENLYVTEKCFRLILKSEFEIDTVVENESNYNRVIEQYKCRMEDVLNASLEINIWLYCQRQYEKINSSNKLTIDSIRINRLIEISLDDVKKNYDYDELLCLCPLSYVMQNTELDEANRFFTTSDRIASFRGKWLLHLFVSFLRLIVNDANQKKSKIFSQKLKVKLNISSGNILSDLSQYAETPPCLQQFLLKNRQN